MKQSSLALACILLAASVCMNCSPSARQNSGTMLAETTSPTKDTNQSAAEQTVIQNERKIWEAFKAKDAKSVDALLADDAMIVTPDGRFTKSEFLRLVPEFPDMPSYSIDQPKLVSPSKDVVILSYQSTYTMKEPAARTYSGLQTTVWVNRGGKWVAIFNQETQPR